MMWFRAHGQDACMPAGQVGVMDFVFSFSGQENWPRLISGMQDRWVRCTETDTEHL